MTIKVTNEVQIYDVLLHDPDLPKPRALLVKSSWPDWHMVVLRIGDTEIVVCAKDLAEAIQNAQNTSPY